MKAKDFELHASELIVAVDNKKILWPVEWKEDILTLSSSLSSYARELNGANESQAKRQSSLHPIHKLNDNATGQYWPSIAKVNVPDILRILSDYMESCAEFEPIELKDEMFPTDSSPSQRYNALRNVALAIPVQVLRYNCGGGASLLVFIQRVPAMFTENNKLTQFMRMLGTIEPQVPIYQKRAMRKRFSKEIGLLNSSDAKPHVL